MALQEEKKKERLKFLIQWTCLQRPGLLVACKGLCTFFCIFFSSLFWGVTELNTQAAQAWGAIYKTLYESLTRFHKLEENGLK